LIGAGALLLPSPLPAQGHRAAVEIAGQSLPLRAKATRDMLFGTVDLYSVGIYAAQSVTGPAELRDAKLTKAIRLAVLYSGGMPATVPSGWWEELMPALTAEQEQHLRRALSQLSSGDDVWITYAPSAGTTIRYRGKVVVSTRTHELMNAVLDLWFDETPVSSDLKAKLVRALAGGD
jgi:hypothetical protein